MSELLSKEELGQAFRTVADNLESRSAIQMLDAVEDHIDAQDEEIARLKGRIETLKKRLCGIDEFILVENDCPDTPEVQRRSRYWST